MKALACLSLPLAAAGLFALAGCEAVAVPFMLLQDHKVAALHRPQPGRLAVLAEPAGPLASRASDPRMRDFADQFAAAATGHLATNLPPAVHGADGNLQGGHALVAAGEVLLTRERDPEAFAAASLGTLAARLGADRILYLELTGLRLPDPRDAGMTGALFTPAAAGSVRIVDREGRRVFPVADTLPGGGSGGFLGGNAGQPFAVELRPRRVGDDATDPASLRRDLADAAGLTVARMFYDWTGPRPGDQAHEERRRLSGRPAPGDQR